MPSVFESTIPLSLNPPKSSGAPRLCLSLIEVVPNKYVDTTVRVTGIKGREKEDELGGRPYIFGVAEDSTFRTPFVCYKPYGWFFRDSVFRFTNAYVHEFEDKSLLLVLSEYSKVDYLSEEDPKRYVWHPKIGGIRRPLGNCWVTLQGVISSVYQSSGLVKRCDVCDRVIFGDSCSSGHEDGWRWSVRLSGRLSDETGSINTILSEQLTCRLLKRPIMEVFYMANLPDKVNHDDFNVYTFQVSLPEELPIHEATVVEPLRFRQSKKVVVPDYQSCRIYCPIDVAVKSSQILDVEKRVLNRSDEDDRFLLSRLFEKAFDLRIRGLTRLPKIHGIYLVEEPVPLYWAENAKLYLGFEASSLPSLENLKVEVYPMGLIRESVLDYYQWRKNRGASAKSVERQVLKWRRNVILAPNGTIGRIIKVLYEDAGGFRVPGLDVPLPEFWKVTHDIEVKPDERPLLVIKPYNLDVELTYPPSCVFFDEQSIYLRSSVLRFVDYKKHAVKSLIRDVALDSLKSLEIGGHRLELVGESGTRLNAQRLVFNDIREKLLGKTLKATGPIIQVNDRLYFLPKTVSGVSQWT